MSHPQNPQPELLPSLLDIPSVQQGHPSLIAKLRDRYEADYEPVLETAVSVLMIVVLAVGAVLCGFVQGGAF